MKLKILLPFGSLIEKKDILRLIVETNNGSVGFLPHRLDCVASVVPGILSYESESEGEKFIAIDEGLLIKRGMNVIVSVRSAIEGISIDQLREAVEKEFLSVSEYDQNIRQSLAQMESRYIQRLVEIKK
jgi:F-type H+-transporting ATPase subunit epsilon